MAFFFFFLALGGGYLVFEGTCDTRGQHQRGRTGGGSSFTHLARSITAKTTHFCAFTAVVAFMSRYGFFSLTASKYLTIANIVFDSIFHVYDL